MNNLTLLIPAKQEAGSLPLVLEELKKYDCNKLIVLNDDDLEKINKSIIETVENKTGAKIRS